MGDLQFHGSTNLAISDIQIEKQPPEIFYKKGVLTNFIKFTRKHLCQSLFFKTKNLTQLFSCKFCEFFKNTFFYKTPRLTASANRLLDVFVMLLCVKSTPKNRVIDISFLAAPVPSYFTFSRLFIKDRSISLTSFWCAIC